MEAGKSWREGSTSWRSPAVLSGRILWNGLRALIATAPIIQKRFSSTAAATLNVFRRNIRKRRDVRFFLDILESGRIGRASCRERVCQYVKNLGGGGS